MELKYEQEAREFCDCIRELAANEEKLESLEAYLSIHFDRWLKNNAATPYDFADEFHRLAEDHEE